MNSSREIRYGSLLSYGMIFVNIILGLIYTPWLLRTIGSSNYGLFVLVTSLITLFLMDFGMSAAVTRFISNYRAEGKQSSINSFAGLSLKFYLIVCTIMGIALIVFYVFVDDIYRSLTVGELEIFKNIYIVVGTFVVICFPVNMCNGILNAYEQYILLKGTDLLSRVGTAVVTIVALVMGGGIYALVLIQGLMHLLTLILKIYYIKKSTPVIFDLKSNSNIKLSEIFTFSAWTTVDTLASQMVFNFIPSILAAVANTLSITYFGFARMLEGHVWNVTQALSGLFLPSVSRLVVNQDNAKDVLPLMIKVGRLNQSVITLLLIGFLLMGKEFVYLWLGSEYGDLYYCILLLISAYFVLASQQIALTSVVVLNLVKYSSLINIITGVFNLIVAYFIAPKYGIIGVCASIALVFGIRLLCHNILYYKVMCIDVITFFKKCHLQMLPGFGLIVLLSYGLLQFMPTCTSDMAGWLLFIGKSLIVSVIYAVVMWHFIWDEYEKGLLKSLIGRI